MNKETFLNSATKVHQKGLKMVHLGEFWKTWSCQTVLSDRSILIGRNAKKSNATFWGIFQQCVGRLWSIPWISLKIKRIKGYLTRFLCFWPFLQAATTCLFALKHDIKNSSFCLRYFSRNNQFSYLSSNEPSPTKRKNTLHRIIDEWDPGLKNSIQELVWNWCAFHSIDYQLSKLYHVQMCPF